MRPEIRRRYNRVKRIRRRIQILTRCIVVVAFAFMAGVILFQQTQIASSEIKNRVKVYHSYEVKEGDTLIGLADLFVGREYREYFLNEVGRVNQLRNPHKIEAGDILLVPVYLDEDPRK